MSSRYGGKIVTDGLILCLDAHDAKSYAGEPANNLNSDTNDYTGTSYSNLGEWTSDPTRLAKSYDSTIKTPIGTGATLIQESGTAGYHHLSRMGGSETGNHTISFYFKPVTNDISDLRICMLGDGSTYIKFDFTQSTPTVTQGGAALSGKLAMLEALNDGWYFCAGDFNGRSGGWVGSVGYSPQSSYTGTSGNKKAYICGLNYNTLAYAVPSFDRSATDGWVDRSGNSNSGTLVNGTNTGVSHYRDGQVIMPVANSYLDFDGTDNYIATSFGNGHNPATNPISYTFWVQHNNTSDEMFAVQGNWSSGGRAYFGTLGGYFNMGIGSSGWTNNSSTRGPSHSSQVWYNVAIVFTGSNAQMYVDGVYYWQRAYSSYTFNQTLDIGSNPQHESNSYAWDGEIAQVLVHNKALTAAEVLSNYNTTKSRFS